jgi:glutamate--cysteine ligase
MMRLTSSLQLNLDYSSEKEAIDILRTALALTPISYALFNHSPFYEGKVTPFQSFRSEVWRRTDSDRSGILSCAWRDDFSFESYARFLWSMPLMFAHNESDNAMVAGGLSLEQISLGQLPGASLSLENYLNPIRQLFTEARLKPGYVEVRSIDGLRPCDRYAAAAFWTGILYSEEARKYSLSVLGGLSKAQREELWLVSSQRGLKTQVPYLDFSETIRTLIKLSVSGLRDRGHEEESYLECLIERFEKGLSPTDKAMAAWEKGREAFVDYSCASNFSQKSGAKS